MLNITTARKHQFLNVCCRKCPMKSGKIVMVCLPAMDYTQFVSTIGMEWEIIYFHQFVVRILAHLIRTEQNNRRVTTGAERRNHKAMLITYQAQRGQ